MKLLFLTVLMIAMANSSKKTLWSPFVDLNDRSTTITTEQERSAREVDGFDPHSEDLHCNDVSTYEPVEWKPKDCEKCTASFPKKSVDKSEMVCIDVPRIKCETIGFTECTMGMETIEYNATELTEKLFEVKECKPTQKTVKHIKKMPECKPVTRHNCVTKWEVLSSGEKVWSGNDDCEEVTWNECKLIDIEVDFNITEIVCKNGTQIPWMDCEQTVKEQMVMNLTCEPKAALECKPVNEKHCTTVDWQEFYQEVEYDCSAIQVAEPYQKVSHKKKCLLTNPDADLDTEVLQDLKETDKYDGPISEKEVVDEKDKSSESDAVTASPFFKAVKRLAQDEEHDFELTADDI